MQSSGNMLRPSLEDELRAQDFSYISLTTQLETRGLEANKA
jgi:hypothetical protein